MYFMVKYHPTQNPRQIKPVVASPYPKFEYFLARSSAYDIDLALKAESVAEVFAYFPHYSSLSNISEDIYLTLQKRSRRLMSPIATVPGPMEISFLVPSEDARPVTVDQHTPSFAMVPLERFEGVTRVQARVSNLEAVMTYWPDSFCHDVTEQQA